MNLTLLWKSFVLILSAILILRVSGRKSIAQMTLAETLVMIAIGTIIVEPVVDKSVVKTLTSASIFVVSILILEFLQLKFNTFEKLFTGKSQIVIENGKLNEKMLKKLRLTVDQLEMRIRNHGISKIGDIKIATIEPNGLLGYELTEDAKPVTVGELKNLLNLYFPRNLTQISSSPKDKENQNIFNEMTNLNGEKHPDHLQ